MKLEDIILMAYKAGFTRPAASRQESFERFAALIAAREREECADEIERISKETYSVVLSEHKEAADWIRKRGEQ